MANHEQGTDRKISPKRGIRALAAGTALMLAASGCADGRQSSDVKLDTNPGVETTTTATQELPTTSTPVIEKSTTTTEAETTTTAAAQSITVDGSECGNDAFEGKIVVNPEDGSWTHYGPGGEVWGTSAEAPTQTPAGLDEEATQAFFCNPGDV